MPKHLYLVNKTAGEKYRLNGALPSNGLPRKANLQKNFSNHVCLNQAQLPPKVDLRSAMTAVEDQSRSSSCTANAIAGAYEYLLKKANQRDIDVSRLFIYYNARVKKNDSDEDIDDTGSSIKCAIEALEESGVCLESIWPFDLENVNECPSDEAYEVAENNKIVDALRINIKLDEMKLCLAQGYPFVFGVKLYKSFDKARKKGIVPMPSSDEQSRSSHGRHAMLAVGYSDRSKSFIVRNSWGTKWGDNGYCYIPYDYMASPTHAFDVWAIRKLENNDMGEEYWDADDADNYQEDSEEEDSENDDDDYDIEEEDDE